MIFYSLKDGLPFKKKSGSNLPPSSNSNFNFRDDVIFCYIILRFRERSIPTTKGESKPRDIERQTAETDYHALRACLRIHEKHKQTKANKMKGNAKQAFGMEQEIRNNSSHPYMKLRNDEISSRLFLATCQSAFISCRKKYIYIIQVSATLDAKAFGFFKI